MPNRPEPDRIVSVEELGSLLKRKRIAEGLTLREVEAQMERALTASSLSRLENGATPDVGHVAVIATWLQIPLSLIAWPGENPDAKEVDTPTAVEVHLRADKNLQPAEADALARMFRLLYRDYTAGNVPVESANH